MTRIESVAVTAQTFGRDSAMFEGLLGFVAQLSVVLWGLVILTAVIRFVGIRMYRRSAARAARVDTVAPSAAEPAPAVPGADAPTSAMPTATVAAVQASATPAATAGVDLVQPAARQLTYVVTNATFDEVVQPAEAPGTVAASVKVPRHGPRNRRAEPRSASHVPALASNSTEA